MASFGAICRCFLRVTFKTFFFFFFLGGGGGGGWGGGKGERSGSISKFLVFGVL